MNEDFGGLTGPVIVLSRNRPNSRQNQVCLYSLVDIDREMQAKYDSCSTATTPHEEIDLAWNRPQNVCYISMVSVIFTPRACARGKVIGCVVVVVVVVSTKIAISRDVGV